jgi:hypothetical protein
MFSERQSVTGQSTLVYIRDGGDIRPNWTKLQTRHRNDEMYIGTRWLGYGCNPDSRCDDYGRILKKEYLQHETKPLERSKFKRTLLEYPFGITEQRFPQERHAPILINPICNSGDGPLTCV